MRPVTSTSPPGRANCDWGISEQRCCQTYMLVRAFVHSCVRQITGYYSCTMMRFRQSRLSLPILSKFRGIFAMFLFLSIHTFPSHLASIGSPLSNLPFFSFPASTIIAWGTFQCVTVCSLQVLFMALFLFKFNQASMEPLEPFQFTTWTQQDGKSNANIKV